MAGVLRKWMTIMMICGLKDLGLYLRLETAAETEFAVMDDVFQFHRLLLRAAVKSLVVLQSSYSTARSCLTRVDQSPVDGSDRYSVVARVVMLRSFRSIATVLV